jgi:uncharacterized membrane protein
MKLFGLQLSFLGWALVVLAFYMVVASPSTLVLIFEFIDHLFLTIAGGITNFLDSAIK